MLNGVDQEKILAINSGLADPVPPIRLHIAITGLGSACPPALESLPLSFSPFNF